MNFRIVTQQQDGFPILLFLVFQCLGLSNLGNSIEHVCARWE